MHNAENIEILDNVIDSVIEIRKSRGLNQGELAELSGIDRVNINRIEAKGNNRIMPRLITFLKTVEALDCEIEIVDRRKAANQ